MLPFVGRFPTKTTTTALFWLVFHHCQSSTTTTTTTTALWTTSRSLLPRFVAHTRSITATTQTSVISTMSATATANCSEGTVNLLDLAAAAVACTVSASRTIQQIAQPVVVGGGDDITFSSSQKNTRTKEDGSFVTDADFAAQGIIVQALATVTNNAPIRIVGEESQEEMERHVGKHEFLDQEILKRTRLELWMRRRNSRLPASSDNAADDDDDSSGRALLLPLAQVDSAEKGAMPPLDQALLNESIQLDAKETDDDQVVVDASRVGVIIDPLDGTKSYADGDYDSVSILIGIVVDNTPVFGVVGKPFGYYGQSKILDTECTTIYGGSLTKGVYIAGGRRVLPSVIHNNSKSGSGNDNAVVDKEQLPRAVISESRSKGVVHDFCVYLGEQGLIHPEPMLVSGAGEKSLRLVLPQSHEAMWFFPKPGTYLWDVAAPDALIRSLGGKLTDKHGRDMDYSKSRQDAENVQGVVAAINADLHADCLRLFHDWPSQK